MSLFGRWRAKRRTEPRIPPFDKIDPETREVVDAMLGTIKYLVEELPESVEGPPDPARIRSREEARQFLEASAAFQYEDRRRHLMSTLDLWEESLPDDKRR